MTPRRPPAVTIHCLTPLARCESRQGRHRRHALESARASAARSRCRERRSPGRRAARDPAALTAFIILADWPWIRAGDRTRRRADCVVSAHHAASAVVACAMRRSTPADGAPGMSSQPRSSSWPSMSGSRLAPQGMDWLEIFDGDVYSRRWPDLPIVLRHRRRGDRRGLPEVRSRFAVALV